MAVAVTAQFRKRFSASAEEAGYVVPIEGKTEFEVVANDGIVVNFAQLFAKLDIYLKATSEAAVRIHAGGRER